MDPFALRTVRAQRPTPEQELFDRVVYAAERCQRQGLAITVETIGMQNDRLLKKEIVAVFGTDKFAHALEQRGIPLDAMAELNPRQRAAVAIYFDTRQQATHAAKLRAAGVTSAEWQGWMRQPVFSSYFSEMAEDLRQMAAPLAKQRLLELVDAGDLKAIDRVLAWAGEFDVRRVKQDNIGPLFAAIFEILDEEGVDSAILQRIGEKAQQILDPAAAAARIAATPASGPGVYQIEEKP